MRGSTLTWTKSIQIKLTQQGSVQQEQPGATHQDTTNEEEEEEEEEWCECLGGLSIHIYLSAPQTSECSQSYYDNVSKLWIPISYLLAGLVILMPYNMYVVVALF